MAIIGPQGDPGLIVYVPVGDRHQASVDDLVSSLLINLVRMHGPPVMLVSTIMVQHVIVEPGLVPLRGLPI